jgi:DedD protein
VVALEERLKQRLTGAAILVALVVLIVPEMFKGRPALRPTQLPAAPNGAPIRSYTLNLDEHGPTSAPVSSTAGADGVQALPTAASSPEPVRPPADAPSDAAASVPSPAQSSEHVTVAERAPTLAARAPAPPAHAPAASAHAPGVPSGAKVGWTVQLGSFQKAENAHRMAQKLTAKGIKTLVVGPDARGYYRVRTPEVADMPAAESLRQKLLQQGFKGVIGTTP